MEDSNLPILLLFASHIKLVLTNVLCYLPDGTIVFKLLYCFILCVDYVSPNGFECTCHTTLKTQDVTEAFSGR
jgi:hypothetical protein